MYDNLQTHVWKLANKCVILFCSDEYMYNYSNQYKKSNQYVENYFQPVTFSCGSDFATSDWENAKFDWERFLRKTDSSSLLVTIFYSLN